MRPDPASLWVNALRPVEIISGSERFELVSSLYGPGSLICWFFLFLSVVVSWTINPTCAKKDSITNDFIAVLSLPVVAVAHFFHQIYQQTGWHDGKRITLQTLFTSLDWDNARVVAAIEAPLTLCEDFITWSAILFFLAARKGHDKRMSSVFVVHSLCFSVHLLLCSDWVPFGSSLLLRPFFFHLIPFFGIFTCWYLLTVFVYLLEVLSGMLVILRKASQPEIESGKTLNWRVFWPGRFSSWMSGCSALVAGIGTLWIKYGWIYPTVLGRSSVRVLPRSTVRIADLDQVVAVMGGFVALLFSLLDAFKERKKAKLRA